MSDCMLDIETIGTGPDAAILTIAAQTFDPLGQGWYEQYFYARIDLDCQENRNFDQSTIDWWAKQPLAAREEAFSEQDRIPLDQALDQVGRIIWHSRRLWTQGPTFDCTILEHAYKSYNKSLPWKYFNVRDSRTIFSLWPGLERPPTAHHALTDCQNQIILLQDTLKYLKIRELA